MFINDLRRMGDEVVDINLNGLLNETGPGNSKDLQGRIDLGLIGS